MAYANGLPTSWVIENEKLAIEATKAAARIFEELGVSCGGVNANGDQLPFGGDEPFENIQDVREAIVLGDQLGRMPWGTNAKDNRSYYIADTGHSVTVKPKDENQPNSESVRKVEAFLEIWMAENQWQNRQSEVSQRCDRHGEVFDLLSYDDDGMIRVYFGEPQDLDDDPKSNFVDPDDATKEYFDSLGVRKTNDVRAKPVAYFLKDVWYPDLRFVTKMTKDGGLANFRGDNIPLMEESQDRILVQHRKRNVLSADPRGLTLYWPVREELIFAKKLLANLMRTSSFQAAFGAIRTIMGNPSSDAVKSYLNTQQTGGGSSGQSETFDMPSTAVVTVPSQIKYEFPETGAGNSNHIETLVSLLRACAAGMKLPEFMLTANVSEGNFASTLVSEGPFHKSMRYEQSLMVQEDLRILKQALWYAAESGEHDLTTADVMQVVLEIKPPRVQTRNRQEDHEVMKDWWDRGAVATKTALAPEGLEAVAENAQRKLELANELPLPAGSPQAPQNLGTPGPTAGNKADPMKEKGVSKKDPTRNA